MKKIILFIMAFIADISLTTIAFADNPNIGQGDGSLKGNNKGNFSRRAGYTK